MDHDYTPADALPEGQAAALAFGISGIVFFIPLAIAAAFNRFGTGLVWVCAGFALVVFATTWWGLTRTEDKRSWPATTRPADWGTDPTDTERTGA